MDPQTINGIVMLLGLAEHLIGTEVIPGLKKFFGGEYQMTAAELADLDEGFVQLSAAREKLKARRAEIAAAGQS